MVLCTYTYIGVTCHAGKVRICVFIDDESTWAVSIGNAGFLAPVKRELLLQRDKFEIKRIRTVEKFEKCWNEHKSEIRYLTLEDYRELESFAIIV